MRFLRLNDFQKTDKWTLPQFCPKTDEQKFEKRNLHFDCLFGAHFQSDINFLQFFFEYLNIFKIKTISLLFSKKQLHSKKETAT